MIERDAADLCFSGGADSKLNLVGMLRLQFAGRIGDTGAQTDGSKSVLPYDASSVGVPGEAGGILTLEAETTAKARGVRQYAEIAGFAATHCGWPPYMTDTERVGARGVLNRSLGYAIWRALNDAGLTPDDLKAAMLLSKPFSSGVLAKAVRRVLDEPLSPGPLAKG